MTATCSFPNSTMCHGTLTPHVHTHTHTRLSSASWPPPLYFQSLGLSGIGAFTVLLGLEVALGSTSICIHLKFMTTPYLVGLVNCTYEYLRLGSWCMVLPFSSIFVNCLAFFLSFWMTFSNTSFKAVVWNTLYQTPSVCQETPLRYIL